MRSAVWKKAEESYVVSQSSVISVSASFVAHLSCKNGLERLGERGRVLGVLSGVIYHGENPHLVNGHVIG